MVFLNLDPYEYSLHKRELWFERAIEAAAALCLMASRERQDLGIIFYRPWMAEPCTLVKPGPFTLLPILERLAAIKRPRGPEGPASLASLEGPVSPAGSARPADSAGEGGEREARLRGSVRSLLDQGKRLPYGARLVYTGPEIQEEDYAALNVLRSSHISLEYLVLDEKRLGQRAPGNAPRYQMREGGYDIL